MSAAAPQRGPLPSTVRAYLTAPALTPLWAQIRTKLEGNGIEVTGAVMADLNEAAASRLAGVLGRPVMPGRRRLTLAELDAALRESAAGRGLVSVLTELTGPLRDRQQARQDADAARSELYEHVDAALAGAQLTTAAWVPDWVRWLRSGVLTRAGDAAPDQVSYAVAALGRLADTSAPWLRAADDPTETETGPAGAGWLLAELATAVAGNAHALDSDRLAGVLALRAATLATANAPARSTAQRRAMWAVLGVEADTLSATVLVWNLRPPGADAWSAMMRSRADLALVTALTLAELDTAGDVTMAAAGTVVSVCENPQVMQAAAQQRVPGTLVCLSGNPSTAGMRLLALLRRADATVRYHGDFDWPGTAVAARIFAAGATPWRMSAGDYLDAVDTLPPHRALPLTGRQVTTAWDPVLATHMRRVGLAVHEEGVLTQLLMDLG